MKLDPDRIFVSIVAAHIAIFIHEYIYHTDFRKQRTQRRVSRLEDHYVAISGNQVSDTLVTAASLMLWLDQRYTDTVLHKGSTHKKHRDPVLWHNINNQ